MTEQDKNRAESTWHNKLLEPLEAETDADAV